MASSSTVLIVCFVVIVRGRCQCSVPPRHRLTYYTSHESFSFCQPPQHRLPHQLYQLDDDYFQT